MRLLKIRQIIFFQLLIASFGLLAAMPAVHAQEIHAWLGNTSNSLGSWSLRDSSVVGGSFEFPIWYDISLEQRLNYLLNFPEPTNTNPQTGSILLDTNINVHLPFRLLGFVPYVTGGIGFMTAVRNDPADIGTNLDINFGGGFKFLIPHTPFGVRFDLRGHRFRNVISEKDLSTFEYSLGLIYRMVRG